MQWYYIYVPTIFISHFGKNESFQTITKPTKMIRIFYILTACILFSVFSVSAQNTTLAEYNLMTITDEFPAKNFEKRMDWSWRDESQRNFLFTYAPVVRLTDNSFVGTYIEIFSKVKMTKEILFVPAQNQSKSPTGNDIESVNRSLAKENNKVFEAYQQAVDELDKKTLQAYHLSLSAYFSRFATTVHLFQNAKLQKGR